jgi:hypothetical protein
MSVAHEDLIDELASTVDGPAAAVIAEDLVALAEAGLITLTPDSDGHLRAGVAPAPGRPTGGGDRLGRHRARGHERRGSLER